MNIYITNALNTYNNGSFMMLINFIYYVNKENKSYNFYVEMNSDEDFKRLKKELGGNKINIHKINIHKVDILEPYFQNTILRKINIVYLLLYKYIKLIFSYKPDTLVVLGGDDISEYYGNIGVFIKLLQLFIISKKIKVFLIGQTIGPFTSYRKKLASFFLKNFSITLRDSNCKIYLENNLGIKNLPIYSDLAFLDLPNQKDIFNQVYGLIENEYIVFVPSGLYEKYCNDINIYIDNLIKIINYLCENKNLKNKKIVLLPHVITPGHFNDKDIINIVKNKDLEYKENLIFIEDDLLSSEARNIIKGAYFTITGRMHPAISSFQVKKPAITLSYSIKYKGIISDDLGLDKFVIDGKGDDLWKKGEVYNNTIKSIDYLINDYENIINFINLKSDESKKLAIQNIDYFIDNIK